MSARLACAIATFAVLLGIAGPAQPQPEKHAPHILVGETTLQMNSSSDQAFWLDGKTLVFVAADNGVPEETGVISWSEPNIHTFPPDKARIYSWAMGAEPQVYRPDAWPALGTEYYRNYVCAQDGAIIYSLGQNPISKAAWPVATGPLGGETPGGMKEDHVGPSWSHSFRNNGVGKRCDQYNAAWMTEVGHQWSISYDQKIILDRGKNDLGPWQYAPVDTQASQAFALVTLPDRRIIPVKGVDPHWVDCVQTPSWEQTFVAWACPTNSNNNGVNRFPIWKIHADGHADRTDFEPGNLSSPSLIPFKMGYAFTTGGDEEADGWGNGKAGLYLIVNGKPKRLLEGHYRSLALSPDGCLDAIADADTFQNGNPREHLIVLDLCAAADPRAAPAMLAEMKPKPADPELPERTALALRYLSASDEGPGLSRMVNKASEAIVPGGQNGADIIAETDRKMAITVAKVLSKDDLLYLLAFYESPPYLAYRRHLWAAVAQKFAKVLNKPEADIEPPAISSADQAAVDAFQKAPRTIAINANLRRIQERLTNLGTGSMSEIIRRQQDLMCSQPSANCPSPSEPLRSPRR